LIYYSFFFFFFVLGWCAYLWNSFIQIKKKKVVVVVEVEEEIGVCQSPKFLGARSVSAGFPSQHSPSWNGEYQKKNKKRKKKPLKCVDRGE
jgi:hypothetical protein